MTIDVKEVSGFTDRTGKLFATRDEAVAAEARHEIERVMSDAIDWQYESLDYDVLLANADDLVRAFSALRVQQ